MLLSLSKMGITARERTSQKGSNMNSGLGMLNLRYSQTSRYVPGNSGAQECKCVRGYDLVDVIVDWCIWLTAELFIVTISPRETDKKADENIWVQTFYHSKPSHLKSETCVTSLRTKNWGTSLPSKCPGKIISKIPGSVYPLQSEIFLPVEALVIQRKQAIYISVRTNLLFNLRKF